MRIIKPLVLLCILFTVLSCGQQQKSSWKYILVNDNTKYPVQAEDSVVNNSSTHTIDTVHASLKVSDPYDSKIRFTQAKLNADTLVIRVYETAEKCSNEFLITIMKGIYKIDYSLSLPSDQIKNKQDLFVTEESSKLMLSTSTFQKGSEVKGYVSFKGWRQKNLGNGPVVVEGIFKVIVE